MDEVCLFLKELEASLEDNPRARFTTPINSFDHIFKQVDKHPEVASYKSHLLAIVYFKRLFFVKDVYMVEDNKHYTESSMYLSVPYVKPYPYLIISKNNMRLIWLACLIIANKILYDIPYNNWTFARMAGTVVSIINEVELAVLNTLRFGLNCDEEKIQKIKSHIAKIVKT